MRFMIIVKANADSEAGKLPSTQELAEMMTFNEQLVKAGVMLAGEGLLDSSKGARVTFSAGKAKVVDGPFTEAKELIAGFWIWNVKSKDDAIAWVKRAPFKDGQLEIRQVFENADFGKNITPELKERDERVRGELSKKNAR
ncbi:MAG TPA: YciI family protein [Gemmatimonadaceae bacterium]|nr:YciI family protein [Gemmatimonadaceae bacterium]